MLEAIRERLFKELAQFDGEDRSMLDRAYALAEKTHEGQYRRLLIDSAGHRNPYIIHPMRVALLLMEEIDLREPKVIAGALLHDVIEDSDGKVTKEDIEREFGPKVSTIVDLLSKPPESDEIPRDEQLHAYHEKIAAADSHVRIVKLADRLDNIREALKTDDRKFQVKYLKETREIYIPLASATSDFFLSSLTELCDRLEEMIDRSQ
jgi:GTP diphosphokinase / guanosine-3',5'-bis(diphosphate) 3'-diphosphatase